MVLIVLFILLILMCFTVKNANKNKFINIIVFYLFSTSMVILIGLLYKSRILQYNYHLNIDYVMYSFLRNIRFSVFTLSRLYNVSFAFLMVSGICCIITLDLFRNNIRSFVIMVLLVVFFLLYNDPDFYKYVYIEAVYYDSVIWKNFILFATPVNKIIVYGYMIAPIVALVVYYFRTQIFTKRRDSLVYGVCIFAITGYISYICFFSVYKNILFWNVDLARLPLQSEGFGEYMSIVFVTFIVIALITMLIVYFDPFNTISIINLQYKRESKKDMEKNFAMILHEHKNAFIGVKHYLNLAQTNMQKENYSAVNGSISGSLDIVRDNLESIDVLSSIIGFRSRSFQKTELINCIQKAISNCSLHDFSKVSFGGFDDAVYVCSNEKNLTRVFENLFFNAIEALQISKKPDPKVTISILNESDAVMVTITDNGTGILKKDIKKIFSIFYSTKTGNNSGVGLNYVVKELQSYNGEIRALSKYGSFTSMQMVLPIYKERKEKKWRKRLK